MSSKLEQLIDGFPRLLRGQGPSLPGYVGAGWHPVVFQLMQRIDALLDDELARGFQLIQIKEKFGGLRFYFSLVDRHDLTLDLHGIGRFTVSDREDDVDNPPPPELARIRKLVEQAEEEARRTCEVCGKPGRLRQDGWMLTLCERHAQMRERDEPLDFEDGC